MNLLAHSQTRNKFDVEREKKLFKAITTVYSKKLHNCTSVKNNLFRENSITFSDH